MTLDDEAVDRALRVWSEEGITAYSAHVSDFILSDESGIDKDALKVADDEAERLNRDLMRRAIKAAIGDGT